MLGNSVNVETRFSLQPDESKLFQTSDCCSLWLGPLPVLAPPSPHRGSVGLFV